MINTNLLRVAMVEAGYSQAKLSKAMNWAPNTTSAKINNKSEITLREAAALCELLQINDLEKRNSIFFAQTISN